MTPSERFPGDRRVVLEGPDAAAIFEAAACAFTGRLVPLESVEPRRAEELDVEAPELDTLLVDFLIELLYRFDTRRWLSRSAEAQLREKDGGWALETTLWGERLDPAHHHQRADAVEVVCERFARRPDAGQWEAIVVFRADPKS